MSGMVLPGTGLVAAQFIPGVDVIVDALLVVGVIGLAMSPAGDTPIDEAHQQSQDKLKADSQTEPCMSCAASTGTPDPDDDDDDRNDEQKISDQKQDGHVKGTPQNANRLKVGKPTSTFDGDRAEADKLTQEAWKKGTPDPDRPNVRTWDAGRRVGTGPRGGGQSSVRVHQDSSGQIHGHPTGPEN